MKNKKIYGIFLVLFCCTFQWLHAQHISNFEYWFDDNFSNRQTYNITAQASVNIDALLTASSLGQGLHTLHFRAKDSDDRWSVAHNQVFYKSAVYTGILQPTTVEYWIDDFTSRTSIQLPAGQPAILLKNLDLSSTTSGLHVFNMRAKDSKGVWSPAHQSLFFKNPHNGGITQLTNVEYWIDSLFNQRISVSMPAEQQAAWLNDLDMSTASSGLHVLNMRAKDSKGMWSVAHQSLFYKNSNFIGNNKIDAYRYWFDTTFYQAVHTTLPAPVNPYELQTRIDLPSSFNYDELHVFHIQFRDLAGHWSAPSADTITYIKIIPQTEFEALKDFYVSTSGSQWVNTLANNQAWDTSNIATVKHWKGVKVQDGKVTKLELPNNKLSGYIPASFIQLSYMDTVLLKQNAVADLETALQPSVNKWDIETQTIICDSINVPIQDTTWLKLPSVALYQHAERNFNAKPMFTIKINSSTKSGNFTATADGFVKIPYNLLGTPKINDKWELTQTTGDAKNSKYTYVVKAINTETVKVTSVSLNLKTKAMNVGDTVQLDATVSPANAANKTVNWISSDSTIATINNGVVTAVASGVSIITVSTVDGGFKDSCIVTVTLATIPVTDITLNKNQTSLMVGNKDTLIATVFPTNATNKTVNWISSDSTVATVNNGIVTAVASGVSIITVSTVDGGFKDSCIVTVTLATIATIPVTDITLNKNQTSLMVGNKDTLIATVFPTNATNKTVNWTSSDVNIATVNNGVITAVSAGQANITVTTQDGGFTATCAITVKSPTGIEKSKAEEAAFVVYPNPVVNGKLIIDLKTSSMNNEATIQLFDFVGKLVDTFAITGEKTEINISHLPSGTYILCVGNRTKKIIKQ